MKLALRHIRNRAKAAGRAGLLYPGLALSLRVV